VTFAQSGFAPPFPQWLHFLSEGPSSFHFRSHSSTVSGQLRYFPARCGTIYVPGQWPPTTHHPPLMTTQKSTVLQKVDAANLKCKSAFYFMQLFLAIVFVVVHLCRECLET